MWVQVNLAILETDFKARVALEQVVWLAFGAHVFLQVVSAIRDFRRDWDASVLLEHIGSFAVFALGQT